MYMYMEIHVHSTLHVNLGKQKEKKGKEIHPIISQTIKYTCIHCTCIVVQLRLPMSIRYSTFALSLELYRHTICMIHVHVYMYMYLINCWLSHISTTLGQGRRGWTMSSHV